MTTDFNFTCMMSCILILRQLKKMDISIHNVIFENCKKMSTPGPVQKYWLVTYIQEVLI